MRSKSFNDFGVELMQNVLKPLLDGWTNMVMRQYVQ